MSRTFVMPELAESVVEGEITAWLVEDGDAVAEDQPLVEVMTDKVTVEIPSPFAGVVAERLAAVGDVVPVGAPLARFSDADAAHGATAGGDGEAAPAAADPEEEDPGAALTLFKAGPEVDEGTLPRVRKPRDGGAARAVAGTTTPARPESPPSPSPSPSGGAPAADASDAARGARPRGPWGRPLAVPAARKRARELGLPLDAVAGSGPHGRIRVWDVEAHAGGGDAATTSDRPVYAGSPLRAPAPGPETTREPLRGLRRVIAQQMSESHRTTVRTLHVDEADVTRLVELRARLKPKAAARGVSLSYLPFVMRALVGALAGFPMLNARWDEDAGEIVRHRDVHLGLAVATDGGLVVPVIRDASRRTLLDLASEAGRLAEAARTGSLTGDDVRGGTFSVTNIGSVGGLFSFPIIHAPQAAILGVHAIKRRPVVLEDDTIAPRSMLYLSLSFDHRLVDGAEAAGFTNGLIALLEEPETLLLDA